LHADEQGILARLLEREAVDGGAEDRREVGVVGLVARIRRQARRFGGEGMDGPDLEARLDKIRFDVFMLCPGLLDGDDHVLDLMLLAEPVDLVDHPAERGLLMLDDRGRGEDGAIEVGEHPLGAVLGAIDGDDAEMLGADPFDAGIEDAAGLVNGVGAAALSGTGV
jgi:hypothetical protein